jgi:hypothetical protein
MMDTTTSSNIIPYDEEELIAFEDTDDAINMIFMIHKSIRAPLGARAYP